MKNLYSDAAHAFHFMIRQLAMMALSICYTLPQQVHLITRTCNLKLYALNARIYTLDGWYTPLGHCTIITGLYM